jgi:phospholipid/cholesterol/gamma-HCH transport system permease protein
MQGIRCGRSSQAVGVATTSAVVSSIVMIVVACAVMTVIFNAMGI